MLALVKIIICFKNHLLGLRMGSIGGNTYADGHVDQVVAETPGRRGKKSWFSCRKRNNQDSKSIHGMLWLFSQVTNINILFNLLCDIILAIPVSFRRYESTSDREKPAAQHSLEVETSGSTRYCLQQFQKVLRIKARNGGCHLSIGTGDSSCLAAQGEIHEIPIADR